MKTKYYAQNNSSNFWVIPINSKTWSFQSLYIFAKNSNNFLSANYFITWNFNPYTLTNFFWQILKMKNIIFITSNLFLQVISNNLLIWFFNRHIYIYIYIMHICNIYNMYIIYIYIYIYIHKNLSKKFKI